MAEDAWRRVHRLFMVDDEWRLERDVDDICVYSQYDSSLGKILKLEVRQPPTSCHVVYTLGFYSGSVTTAVMC